MWLRRWTRWPFRMFRVCVSARVDVLQESSHIVAVEAHAPHQTAGPDHINKSRFQSTSDELWIT